MNESDDLVEALAPVVRALRDLGIPHFVGGSIASSFHGATRSTMDVDLVCELTEDKVTTFASCFARDFYISEPAVRDAVLRKSCFNLIHLPTSFKVDVFVSRRRPFDNESMRRATTERLGESKTVDVPIASSPQRAALIEKQASLRNDAFGWNTRSTWKLHRFGCSRIADPVQ